MIYNGRMLSVSIHHVSKGTHPGVECTFLVSSNVLSLCTYRATAACINVNFTFCLLLLCCLATVSHTSQENKREKTLASLSLHFPPLSSYSSYDLLHPVKHFLFLFSFFFFFWYTRTPRTTCTTLIAPPPSPASSSFPYSQPARSPHKSSFSSSLLAVSEKSSSSSSLPSSSAGS